MANCTNCGQVVAGKGGVGNVDVFNRRFCCGACKKEYYGKHRFQGFVIKIMVIGFILYGGYIYLDNRSQEKQAFPSRQESSTTQSGFDEFSVSIKEVAKQTIDQFTESNNQAKVSPQPSDSQASSLATPTTEASQDTQPSTHSGADGAKSDTDSIQLKIADLKGNLAVVDVKIESERTRWKNAHAVINKHTNFDRKRVWQGSPQYAECLAASKIIKAVEAGVPALKAEKAKLKAMIQSLEGK